MVNPRHGQQRRDRHVVGIYLPVREDNQVAPPRDGRIDVGAERVHGLGEASLAVLALEQDRNRLRLVAKAIDLPDLF